MEKKFATESEDSGEGAKIKISQRELDGFKRFDESIKEISKVDKGKDGNISKVKCDLKEET